jgi:hypothetical protein
MSVEIYNPTVYRLTKIRSPAIPYDSIARGALRRQLVLRTGLFVEF